LEPQLVNTEIKDEESWDWPTSMAKFSISVLILADFPSLRLTHYRFQSWTKTWKGKHPHFGVGKDPV